MLYGTYIKNNGYVMINDVFTESEIDIFKQEILKYISSIPKNKRIIHNDGITIPDFIKKQELRKTASIKDNKKIRTLLTNIFEGTNYRFCNHNDIGIDRIVNYHKDRLNGKYRAFEKHDIWGHIPGTPYLIVKVLIYLQDHTNDNCALAIVPKSNLMRTVDKNTCCKNELQLHPKKGSVIIFDQRLNHRGMLSHSIKNRILVSFGFGRNNIFTDEFEKGTLQRQNDQNNVTTTLIQKSKPKSNTNTNTNTNTNRKLKLKLKRLM